MAKGAGRSIPNNPGDSESSQKSPENICAKERRGVVSKPKKGHPFWTLWWLSHDLSLNGITESELHDVQNEGDAGNQAKKTVFSCSVLCRSAVIDHMSRIAVYELLADADIQLKVHMARFLLHQVCIIPIEEFSAEYVRPQVHCIASYGRFVNQSATCVSLAHETPPTALILDVLSGRPFPRLPQQSSPSLDAVPGVTLKAPQNQVTLRGRVPHLGRYSFVIHFYQAEHPTFPAWVLVDGGRPRAGSFRASFCPHVLGCRDQVIAEGQIEFDISEPEVAVTVKVPEGKSLVLIRVLVMPAENYDYQILHKKSIDKSLEFITNCGKNSFYIDSRPREGLALGSVLFPSLSKRVALSPRGTGTPVDPPVMDFTMRCLGKITVLSYELIRGPHSNTESENTPHRVPSTRKDVSVNPTLFCHLTEQGVSRDTTPLPSLLLCKVPMGSFCDVSFGVLGDGWLSPAESEVGCFPLFRNSRAMSPSHRRCCVEQVPCLVSATPLEPLALTVAPRVGSAHAGPMSSGGSAPAVQQATTDSHTVGTSWKLLESLAVGAALLEASRPLTLTWYFFIPWPACSCGRNLCEEMTGQCRCPPRTIRPQCEACETHSFSFHPMAGCEACNCSRRGTVEAATLECDRDSGQCR
ncbi:hypothetical protein P7K49_028268 [Saguinus oedipus]|uniref:Uncharacterized protein n=1 Tax=Saguinus oedipus TaxID=9490 RepID=A0ABQ9UCR9_SAGOE|nr:hypothetical protein P7K49_028268 [Saguinus oedipus]